MPPRDPRTPAPTRRGFAAVLAGLLTVAVAGCGVLELGEASHEAVVLEAATPAAGDRWTMVVELLQTEIAGEAVVAVAFEDDQVACIDGGSIPATELTQSTELRFEQGRDGVEPGEEEEPPVVSGVEVAVHCD